MSLKNEREFVNTKIKLAELERRYAEAKGRVSNNPHAHALSLRSMASLIKELKEELVLFEVKLGAADHTGGKPSPAS